MKYTTNTWNTLQIHEIHCKDMKFTVKTWNSLQRHEIHCKDMKFTAKAPYGFVYRDNLFIESTWDSLCSNENF